MLKRICFGVYIIVMHMSVVAIAQNSELKFDRISIDQGLSQGNVSTIYQDRLGYIWVGTEDGLNLYDGYSFKIFTSDADDIHSLSSNTIRFVNEDIEGNLWVGAATGLHKFNRDRGDFDRYIHDPNDPSSIVITGLMDYVNDAESGFWVAISGGVAKYDPSISKFKMYQHGDNGIIGSLVSSMTQDQEGRVWLATDDGVSRLNPKNETFKNYQFDPTSQSNVLTSNDIKAVYADSKNRLWIGSFDTGLTVLDLNTNQTSYYQHHVDSLQSLSNNFVTEIVENEAGAIWIATDGGLNEYVEDGTFVQYLNNPNNPNSLAGNIVADVFFDRNQVMWVGSRYNGLSIFDENKYGFDLFKNSPNDPNSLSSNNTSGFVEDRKGNFYVLTDGEGINYYNRKTGKFQHIRHDPNNPNSLTNNKTLAIEIDDDGNLWIGMWGGGVNKYDVRTKQFTHYKNDPNDRSSLSGNNIFDIFKDHKGNIWVGTWGSGLSRYIESTDSFINYQPDPNDPNSVPGGSISSMLEDKHGNIWLASGNEGVSMYNPNSEVFTNYRAGNQPGDLSMDGVLAVYMDSKDRLWVGTNGGGLNILDISTGKFELLTIKDGLPNDAIMTILEDSDGMYWIGTNRGLCKLDYDNMTIRNYYKSDGIQSNQFMPRNALKLSTGELLFGGNGGFNLFDPQNLYDNPVEPLVYITDFKLFDKRVEIGADKILQENIIFTDAITLKHDENIFSFDYTGINYRHTEKNQYKYILEGLQEEWVEAGTRRTVSFMNLEPNEYVFKVLAANNDGLWATTPATVRITVLPPFWATWWFRAILALIILSTAMWVYQWRANAAKMNRMILENKVKEATAQVKSQNMALEAQSESLKLAIQDTNFVLKEALDAGNYSARIDTVNKEGEWKALGDSINQLFESVWKPFNNINRIVNKMAEGDLTERYVDDAKGDILVLSQNLNKAMDNLSELLSDISVQVNVIGSSSEDMLTTSEEMNVSTGEIASSISEMSRGAQEQVVKVDESSNLIEGILRFSTDMGDQADSINQTARMGVEKSDAGMKQIEKLDVSMKDILEYSDKTNGSIGELTKRSTEISGVVRIIKEIASQTNLLALNAAIEAAQAGDAGRGFAVVAEEIRKLAEDSKKSAGEIEALIAAVQKDTTATASVIGEMSSSIKEGEEATVHSKTAFSEITQYYSETLKKSEQILAATKQQTEDIGNVVNIINGVVVIAEETAAGTEETASSSSQLSVGMTNYTEKSKHVSEIADALRDKVGKFILKKYQETVEQG